MRICPDFGLRLAVGIVQIFFVYPFAKVRYLKLFGTQNASTSKYISFFVRNLAASLVRHTPRFIAFLFLRCVR